MSIHGVSISVKWLGEGGLRQAREVLAHRRTHPDIVVARRISPGAREALSEAGIGWVDESGAAEIIIGSIIVSKSGRPDAPRERPSRWTPAVLAVAEALLCGAKATVSATEEMTTLATATCTYALRILFDLGLLTSDARRGRGSARRIVDADHLLDAYATAAAAAKEKTTSLRVGVTWRDMVSGLMETGRQWDKAGQAWAATGALAASVMAPYLTSVVTGEVYVDANSIASLEFIAAEADLRPIEGGRIVLMPFPTVSTKVLAKEQQGLRVAPWPRVYTDLKTMGVRGEEAAEHLREVLHG